MLATQTSKKGSSTCVDVCMDEVVWVWLDGVVLWRRGCENGNGWTDG